MSKDAELNKLAKDKEVSRKIVSEILDFGVNEEQKLDIMYFIALTLINNKSLKDITKVLNEYREKLGDKSENNKSKSKLLL